MPIILPIPDNFSYRGSFARRTPYVTDIDAHINVHPQIDGNTIYPVILEILSRVEARSDIMMLYVRTGYDNRFIIRPETRNDDLIRVRNLLPSDKQKELDLIIDKYKQCPEEDLDHLDFMVGRLIKDYYRIQWSPEEIKANCKELPGDKTITMTESLLKNSFLLMRYYVKIGPIPIGLDLVVTYNQGIGEQAYEEDFLTRHIRQSNYENHFYYVLFPIRSYIRDRNRKVHHEINKFIDYTHGHYKQLTVKIEDYKELYSARKLNLPTASAMVRSIASSTAKLVPDSNIPSKLREVLDNNEPGPVKMRRWFIILNILEDNLRITYNKILAKDLYYFLSYLDPELRPKFFYKYEDLTELLESQQSDST